MGGSLLIVKALARTDPPHTIVLYMGLYSAPFALVMALPVWVTPAPGFLLATFLLGAMGSCAHLLLARALTLADASFVAPHDFLRLPLGAMIGWIWFSELMDGWSWVGAGMILLAAAFVARREAQLGRFKRS